MKRIGAISGDSDDKKVESSDAPRAVVAPKPTPSASASKPKPAASVKPGESKKPVPKTATPKTAATKTSTPKTAAPKAKPSGTTQAAKSSGAKSPTVKELREQAKAKGIKGYSSMTKAELLNAVGGA